MDAIERLIRNRAGSTIFSAQFIKKDGSVRVMACRLRVRKGVKGVGHRFEPASKQLLQVFDVRAADFRFINLATLQRLRIRGRTYDLRQNKGAKNFRKIR